MSAEATRILAAPRARNGIRQSAMSTDSRYALNAICPYFTMFPLEYPLRALSIDRLKKFRSPIVFDPYCGRGTTIFAARLRGIRALGIDVEPVAVAIAQAKLAQATSAEVMDLFDELIGLPGKYELPTGAFWRWVYSKNTLDSICRIRSHLVGRRTNAAIILRAVMLGALHGPKAKDLGRTSYFSNQMPRTFAPKPDYSVRYWKRNNDLPPKIDVRSIVQKRVERVLKWSIKQPKSKPIDIRCSNSRFAGAYSQLRGSITHVVTSPPYYGLRTYSQDQWMRGWFLGGCSRVDYQSAPGLDHGSPDLFAQSLADVWNQIGDRASSRIEMFVRFGGISSRQSPADEILRLSLTKSRHNWRVVTRHGARTAEAGKRQAIQMSRAESTVNEYDYLIALK